MIKQKPIRYLVQGAIIAALYTALTLILAPISFGPLQCRVAEALTILPFFTPAAVPGLFIGCAISNVFGGFGLPDIIFGSIATLAAAYCTYKIKNKWLAPLPSVIINALVIGIMLSVMLELPPIITILEVGVGQILACYGIGLPLLLVLQKYGKKVFYDKQG